MNDCEAEEFHEEQRLDGSPGLDSINERFPEDARIKQKQPCIVVLDSLGGRKDHQTCIFAILREYLTQEYIEKYPGSGQKDFPRGQFLVLLQWSHNSPI